MRPRAGDMSSLSPAAQRRLGASLARRGSRRCDWLERQQDDATNSNAGRLADKAASRPSFDGSIIQPGTRRPAMQTRLATLLIAQQSSIQCLTGTNGWD